MTSARISFEDDFIMDPAEPPIRTIFFRIGERELLRLCENGDIYVRAELAASNLAVVEGFREWLDKARERDRADTLETNASREHTNAIIRAARDVRNETQNLVIEDPTALAVWKKLDQAIAERDDYILKFATATLAEG